MTHAKPTQSAIDNMHIFYLAMNKNSSLNPLVSNGDNQIQALTLASNTQDNIGGQQQAQLTHDGNIFKHKKAPRLKK